MGQRLNIEIHDNGKLLANAYYHWDAYTGTALEHAKTILDNVLNIKDHSVLSAVRLLETTGAGLTSKEIDYMKLIYLYSDEDFMQAFSLNEGFISVSPDGMRDTRYWEEGRVVIDIGTQTMDFMVYCSVDFGEYEEIYETSPLELKEFDVNLGGIPFADFHTLESIYKENPCGFRTPQGEVILWIE